MYDSEDVSSNLQNWSSLFFFELIIMPTLLCEPKRKPVYRLYKCIYLYSFYYPVGFKVHQFSFNYFGVIPEKNLCKQNMLCFILRCHKATLHCIFITSWIVVESVVIGRTGGRTYIQVKGVHTNIY